VPGPSSWRKVAPLVWRVALHGQEICQLSARNNEPTYCMSNIVRIERTRRRRLRGVLKCALATTTSNQTRYFWLRPKEALRRLLEEGGRGRAALKRAAGCAPPPPGIARRAKYRSTAI
jgi:hypothetical protein